MFNNFFYFLWITLQILIGYNLIMPIVLYIIYVCKPKKRPSATKLVSDTQADYAVIVTAYEQTHTLPPVIESLLQLQYSNYLIYIVADKCDVSNLNFNNDKVIVLRPPETLASNTKSHFYAIEHFQRLHDRLTIIDSDNLVKPDYLLELNKLFDRGYIAVQGERKAKNLNTTFACLDAARDIYYHFYDGKVLFQIGSSATLAGSGMAFTVDLYKECLASLTISGAGFDKVLQKEIVLRKHQIAFTDLAVVYDEKTAESDQLVKQRARWINTWFKYSKFGIHILGKGLLGGNFNQSIFGLILLRPPLFIFLLLSILFAAINLFINPLFTIIWLVGLLLFVFGFAIALWSSEVDERIWKSLINIPTFIFFQVRSLMKAKNANKHSVATKHSFTETQKP